MAQVYKNTESEQRAIDNKAWWHPVFDEYGLMMDVAIKKRGLTLDQFIARGTQAWLDRYADDMYVPHLTVEQFAEYATSRYNDMKERGWY